MAYGDNDKCAAIEVRPILDEVFDSAHTANERLGTVINRLRRLNDKVFGARPPEPNKAGVSVATPPGAAQALRAELDDLHRQMEKADELLTQIERFV